MMNAARVVPVVLSISLTCFGCGSGDSGGGDGSADARGPVDPPPATCDEPVSEADVSTPTTVVGDGTAASCTEAAFRAAADIGGVITFECGADPVTITLTSQQHITVDTVIDGGGTVTLSGGNSTRILYVDTNMNFEATSPLLIVQNIRFIDARSSGEHTQGGGGAIFYHGGSVTAINAQFENNHCVESGPDVAGGAIYGIGVGTTTVVRSTFVGNVGASGGAIGALGSSIVAVNSHFEANRASGSAPGGNGGNGGAMYMDGQGRLMSICGCTYKDNEAGGLGGALFRTGYETEPNPIHLSTFDGNYTVDRTDDAHESGAGAMYLQGVHVTLTNSTVSNNRARGGAGVRVLAHGSARGLLEMTNCTLYGNSTYERSDFTTRGVGGALVIGDATDGFVRNCTIVDNAAQFGSGIWNASPLTITNTIISNHADNEWTPLNCSGSSYASPSASGENNIQWPNGVSDDDMDCTPNIVRTDPMMGELADNGGATLTVMPTQNSPAIGMGTNCPDTDQRGEPRDPDDCTIGALEP